MSLRGRVVELLPLSRPGGAGTDAGTDFAVVDSTTRTVVGFVGLDASDPAAGVASLSVRFDPRADRSRLLAADALPLFCEHAFATAGFRKLTIELAAPLAGHLRAAARRLDWITFEGTRRAHVRVGQVLCDVDIYAVWATEFLARSARHQRGCSTHNSFVVVADAIAFVCPGGGRGHVSGRDHLVDDLELDSLALAELFELLERRTERRLPLDALDTVVCVQDLVTLVDHARLARR